MKIDLEDALELWEQFAYVDKYGGVVTIRDIPFKFITDQRNIADGRWTATHILVFEDANERLWGLQYEEGLTEYQDTGPFDFYEPELVPVEQETKIVYKPA